MPLYRDAISRFASLVEAEGYDPEQAISTLDRIDQDSVSSMGFTVRRFEHSMLAAYAAISQRQGAAKSDAECKIRAIAAAVADSCARTIDGTDEVLKRLHEHFSLVLLTKGEEWLQARRVRESGLQDCFDMVRIVPRKTRETFNDLAAFGLCPRESWSVGDSIRSDILPAVEAGFNAVWLVGDSWDYERMPVPDHVRLHVCRSLEQVEQIVCGGSFA
jgi:putative hydrolase of the HAD superfamily